MSSKRKRNDIKFASVNTMHNFNVNNVLRGSISFQKCYLRICKQKGKTAIAVGEPPAVLRSSAFLAGRTEWRRGREERPGCCAPPGGSAHRRVSREFDL